MLVGPGDEFKTLAEAANDFGNGYFGYSQENIRETGTNFYQTADGKFSYAKPVIGLAGEVDVSKATEGIPTDAVIVGNGHTHPFIESALEVVRPVDGTTNPNPIGSKEASTLKLENFTTDGGPTNTKKYQIENGSNAPSGGDKDIYQSAAKNNPNYIASYLYTGSGLVYSAKKDKDGNLKTQVQGTLSKTSPSTSKSSIRINTNPAPTIPPTIPKEAISR